MRVLFVVGRFPAVEDSAVLPEAVRLLVRGVDVRVLALEPPVGERSRAFDEHGLEARTRYVDMPDAKWLRLLRALPVAMRLARRRPRALLAALDVPRHRRLALSLRLLYVTEALAGQRYDIVHCHSGEVACLLVQALAAAGLDAPLVTSLTPSDPARSLASPARREPLARAGAAFLVSSESLRDRVIALGFPAERVHYSPVGTDLDAFAFRERALASGEPLRMAAMAHFTDRSGVDDVLRAFARARERSTRPLELTVSGEGPLLPELLALREALGLADAVRIVPFPPLEGVPGLLADAHVFVHAPRTAPDGAAVY